MVKKSNADLFLYYVSLELKGAITAQNWTLTRLATAMGRNKANLSLWLNGKRDMPIKVLYEICALIGVEPRVIVGRAQRRLQGKTEN
ncbi:MAG: helix-turn-helix domain-containing protein [Arcanobacterium sp.]|nr:helix-turn-helix domain-containing protein [Arcanobacterium sp.]MDY6142910.1 helix-turn-helix transcriptional regulator [Arcanobacterium sp.]